MCMCEQIALRDNYAGTQDAAPASKPWIPPTVEELPPLAHLTLVSPEPGGGDVNGLSEEFMGSSLASVFGGMPD